MLIISIIRIMMMMTTSITGDPTPPPLRADIDNLSIPTSSSSDLSQYNPYDDIILLSYGISSQLCNKKLLLLLDGNF